MLTKDLYLALMVILFSIVSYIIALPYPDNSAYFPRFIIILLGFLGCLILIKELRNIIKTRVSEPKTRPEAGDSIPLFHRPAFIKVTLMIVSSSIYLLVINWVGFFASALVYLPIMMWVLGIRKVRTIITATLVIVFFIYLIFGMFLKVPFPEGVLF